MNKAIMIGRLTKDVEYNGKYARINLAVDLNKEETLFLPITCFGRVAEVTSQWLHKGDMISAEIIIKNNNYQDKEGNNKYEFQFIANKINFLQTKRYHNEEPENKITYNADELENAPW